MCTVGPPFWEVGRPNMTKPTHTNSVPRLRICGTFTPQSLHAGQECCLLPLLWHCLLQRLRNLDIPCEIIKKIKHNWMKINSNWSTLSSKHNLNVPKRRHVVTTGLRLSSSGTYKSYNLNTASTLLESNTRGEWNWLLVYIAQNRRSFTSTINAWHGVMSHDSEDLFILKSVKIFQIRKLAPRFL